MVKISVIVPLYNSEKFIEHCISSLTKQKFSNFEVLLIDDGSTDGSQKICLDFASRFSNIHYYYKENGGVSSARNFGLRHARGEFIAFCDSDDIVNPFYLSTLFNLINHNDKHIDMSMCQMVTFGINNSLLWNNDYSFLNCIFKDEAIATVLTNPEYSGFLWNKLFKKNIIMDNNIFFDPNISIKEDLIFVIRYLIHCNFICETSMKLYGYRKYNDSSSSKAKNDKWMSIILADEQVYNELKNHKYSSEANIAWNSLIKDYAFNLKYAFSPNISNRWKDVIVSGYKKYQHDGHLDSTWGFKSMIYLAVLKVYSFFKS